MHLQIIEYFFGGNEKHNSGSVEKMNIDDFNPLLLNVGKAVHNADWNWSNVCSPFARIYYVVSGAATVTIEGRSIALKPGMMYIIPPFTRHFSQCDGEFVHYYLHIYEDGVNGRSILDEYEFPTEIKGLKGDHLLFERLTLLNPSMSLKQSDPTKYDNDTTLKQTIIQNKQRSEWLKMESRGIVFQICSRFLVNASIRLYVKDNRMYDTMRFIHRNLANSTTTEQLASMAGLSPEHFIRIFSRTVGTTPMQYVNQKRIERSQLLLLTTKMTVKQIASALGYPDSSYFVRVFRRITQTTPIEYRKTVSINK